MAVTLKRDGDFAVLTLDRPEALNALSFAIIRQIGEALDAVAEDSSARALLITGAGGKAFCAGADIKELRNRSLIEQKRGAELGQGVFAKLDDLPIASIALVCTFRLASSNAKFGLPEVKLGLIPGYGGTQRLPRVIGQPRALEMIMTGRTVDAEEAERIGLVNRIAEGDLLEAGKTFAAGFTRYSLPVLGFARSAVSRACDLPLHEGLRVEAELSTLAYNTADAVEGMAAFEEKRKPEFRDA
jgi:enoyl-CoA hydratase